MITNYVFLNKNYNNVKDLAVAMNKNYADALNYIFTPNFINQFDDLYLKGRIKTEISRCKYAESALSMILYLLNPDLGLCVRGLEFKTLEDLAIYMNDTSKNKLISIENLFLDNCISHTLGQAEGLPEKFYENIVYIEDNIKDPAIYEFFIDIFEVKFKRNDAHGLSIFDYYLSTIQDMPSKLDAFIELASNPGFKAQLFNEFGLKKMIEVYSNKSAPFTIINMLEDKTQNIRGLLDQGISSWLLKNYKNYNFSMKANSLLKNIKEARDEYYANKFETPEEEKDDALKFNEKIYYIYKAFINYYDCGLIREKSEEYRFDILYNKVRTCVKYYKDINLDINFAEYRIKINDFEKPEVKKITKYTDNELGKYFKVEKVNKKETKYEPFNYKNNLIGRIFIQFISLLIGLASLGLIAYNYFNKNNYFNDYNNLAYVLLGGLIVLFTIYGILSYTRSYRVIKREFLTRDLDFYNQSKETKTLGYKVVYRKRTIYNILLNTLVAAVLVYITFNILYLFKIIKVEEVNYYLVGIVALASLLISSLFRKSKFIYYLLLILVPTTIILLKLFL